MDAHVNGIRLAYAEYGQGDVLLLIHAFPLSGALWEPQVAALSQHYRVLVPDLRGFGRSEVPDGPYAMQTFAADLVGLLDTLEINRAIVVGVSMGGYIAFALLRHHAERLRGLVLCDTRATPDSDEARAGREATAQRAEREGASAIAEAMVPRLLSANANESLRAEVRAIIEANNPAGIAAALRGMAQRPDSSDLLAQITIPTLVMVGERDELTPVPEVRAMRQQIPHSRCVQINNAGHLPNLEQPAAFTPALLGFLGSISDSR